MTIPRIFIKTKAGAMSYQPHPPWRVEEDYGWSKTEYYASNREARHVDEHILAITDWQEGHRFRTSIWLIIDGSNTVVATVGDQRDAELIVDQMNAFFDSLSDVE
jgi:hypothetical protein